MSTRFLISRWPAYRTGPKAQITARGRKQRPGHSGLCGALDRSGRGLFQGAGHPRCRPDGRPRDLPDFRPALANWLHHGVVTRGQVMDGDAARWPRWWTVRTPAIRPIRRWRRGLTAIAFQAACDLVFKGREQPSGYTEPVLHAPPAGVEGRAAPEGTTGGSAPQIGLCRRADPAGYFRNREGSDASMARRSERGGQDDHTGCGAHHDFGRPGQGARDGAEAPFGLRAGCGRSSAGFRARGWRQPWTLRDRARQGLWRGDAWYAGQRADGTRRSRSCSRSST